ncbi:MAG: phosphatase domain-containing protein [Bdellovibrionota bacterium]|nr:phosphatase domain-containing protein [Bdellovibrionota bacterium]
MKRPTLVHFLSLKTEESLNIKASITMKENILSDQVPQGFAKEVAQGIVREIEKELPTPRFPIQAYKLLSGSAFQMKITGIGAQQEVLFKKTYDTDSFGNLSVKIPLNAERSQVKALQVYEVGKEPGLELHLGTFIPLEITNPKKIIICDFDKTLVDTKYSTTSELYKSLTKPMEYFPTVTNSVDILKGYIDKGFHPFILSASPHFYEEAMRDWLYKNQIYTAGIFLKDYRHVFSLFELDLTPKDLKIQGLYKINHLLDILLLTGIPDELVLMGDNFESDPIIYLSLTSLLKETQDPWQLWNYLRKLEAFQMNRKQNSILLNKVYQISNLLSARTEKGKGYPEIKIFIRKKVDETSIEMPESLNQHSSHIELYEGLPPSLAIKESQKLKNKEALEQKEE